MSANRTWVLSMKNQLERSVSDLRAEAVARRKSGSGTTHRERPDFGWIAALAVVSAGLAASPVRAGSFDLDFNSDPLTFLTGYRSAGQRVWAQTGGNSGGFLALNWPLNDQRTTLVFPDSDPGRVVTAFDLNCDLRIGNSSGASAGEGFSFSFARDGDPILANPSSDLFAANCCAETGTKTGLSVMFNTRPGSFFPNDPADATDVVGLTVRVDDVTVAKVELPTVDGRAEDSTSLQTGPRDAAFWALPDANAQSLEAWQTLAWVPLRIRLTEAGRLTVSWKGKELVDELPTGFLPSLGRLVLAGRTSDANQHVHLDNLRFDTRSLLITAIPGPVINFRATEVGARRVALAWEAASIEAGNRVLYEIERDGVVIATRLAARKFEDRRVVPGRTYQYKIRAKSLAGIPGPDVSVNVTTVAEVPGVGFLRAEQWTGIGGSAVEVDQSHFRNDPPDRVRYVNGLSFGETSGFRNTWGDNYQVKITGAFTAPESGLYRFHLRSDQASRFYLNTSGPVPPDPSVASPIAVETECCGPFEAPISGNETVSLETGLVAGQSYGLTFVVKEATGSDWGQVAVTFPGRSKPILLRGAILSGLVDPVGASVAISRQPATQTVEANSRVTFNVEAQGTSPYAADYGGGVSYQWYQAGQALLGENGPSYSIEFTPAGADGQEVWCVVAVAGASVTTAKAKLTVTPDVTPPGVVALRGVESRDAVLVTFSEPVTRVSAETVTNYVIQGLTVNAATLVDIRTVRLATSQHADGGVYPVTINGVLDVAGLPSAFTGNFHAFVTLPGTVSFRMWQGQSGGFSTWNQVRNQPPTESFVRRSMFSGTNLDDWYFGQLRTLFTPSQTGDYVFFVAGDDNTELYVSPDANPANKRRVAKEPVWGDPMAWIGGRNARTRTNLLTQAVANRSDKAADSEWPEGSLIHLEAGQTYYLEALYKEATDDDHGGATMMLAGQGLPVNGTSALTGNQIAFLVDPWLVPPQIIGQDPLPVLFNRGETVRLSVEFHAQVPVEIQWYRNGVALQGATNAVLTLPNAGVQEVGDYRVELRNAGTSVVVSSGSDNHARVVMRGAVVIEAEDFNYGGGLSVPAASTMPLVSDLFRGLDGFPEVDFHHEPSDLGGASPGLDLRNGWEEGLVFHAPPDGLGGDLQILLDNSNGGAGPRNNVRPEFVLANNYRLASGGAGNWFNYTRDFATAVYNVVWVGSAFGLPVGRHGRVLELVTSDPSRTNQTTTIVGELTFNETGGWGSNDPIPFHAPGWATPAEVVLGPNSTLRVRVSEGAAVDDYLLVYQAASVAQPQFTSSVRNPDGTVTLTWVGGGTLETANSLSGPWIVVPGANSPFTLASDQPQQFARIRVP